MKYLIGLFIAFMPGVSVRGQQLVLPGDYPDPSVIKIGDTYWASATSSNWFPAFPLMKSKDLVNWKPGGYVFNKMPEWADYYFWAPEISQENGRVYIYYAAHKKNGNLCVAVASADTPEGPYRDHGPLMCEEDGSIDAFPIRDENGKLYLIWKEDGNSVRRPTPIWAMAMNEGRTALLGEKRELFKNSEPWEANLVEGVSIVRHSGYFYAFYAAAGCCGVGCTYQTGVARAKNLFGPWEKYEKNPIMANTAQWICPGHGTPVEKEGKFYFLYHAYNKKTNVFTGREGLLIEFRFTPDGWIKFVDQPSIYKRAVLQSHKDDFNETALSEKWQWSVSQDLNYSLNNGKLHLKALPTSSGAFIGQRIFSGNYTATALIDLQKNGAAAGVAAIGNDFNIISVLIQGDTIKISQVKEAKQTDLLAKPAKVKDKIHLRMRVSNGKDISFLYSTNGTDFILLNQRVIEGSFLPPWDRAVRVGLVSKGAVGLSAHFDNFILRTN